METSLNNKCKAFTSLEQSKALAEILPIESADMRYAPFGDIHPWVWDGEVKLLEKGSILCWSLSALLSVLPSVITRNGKRMFLTLEKAGAFNLYYKSPDRLDELWETDEEVVDACVEMIVNLHKEDLDYEYKRFND